MYIRKGRFYSELLTSFALISVVGCATSNASEPGAHCESDRVRLQMLGTHGPELLPGDTQASTSYLIWLDDKARVIIDAGPGSLQNFKRTKANFEDVDLILFSHFHVDHSADFSAYIKAAFFTSREKDLNVIGPSGSDFVLSANDFVDHSIGHENGLYPYLGNVADPLSQSPYNIKTKTVEWNISDLSIQEVYKHDGIEVLTVATHHGPFPSLGYRVEMAGCAISFSGDMSGRLGAMPRLAKDSDILVAHNAVPEDITGVAANLHMKPSTIGELAAKADPSRLLLTHLMERSLGVKPETLQLIGKSYAGQIDFPKDLDSFHP